MHIRFSHNYPKLHDQKTARLLHLQVVCRLDMHNDFIQYDTSFPDKDNEVDYYPLPDGKYILLVFLGDKLIPFTTARPFSEEKFRYYKLCIGKIFNMLYPSSHWSQAWREMNP